VGTNDRVTQERRDKAILRLLGRAIEIGLQRRAEAEQQEATDGTTWTVTPSVAHEVEGKSGLTAEV
jgi:hypothetical protein